MFNENYVKKIIESGTRLDGRGFDRYRNVSIKVNALKNAEGSADVSIGNSRVLVGIKLGVMAPFPDTPNEGVLMVGVELDPLAAPEFEPGPPNDESVEIARVVDRALRESHAIEMEKLVIKEGEKVWSLSIDIQILDHDGNLIDASCLGAIAALLTTKIPKYNEETERISLEETSGELPIVDVPIEVTVAKIGGKLLVDLTKEEESALDARLTIGTTRDGNLCAMQKGGNGYFSMDEIREAVELGISLGSELRETLKNSL